MDEERKPPEAVLRRRKIRELLTLCCLLLVAVAVFATGLTWGLPTKGVDAYLFGSHVAWSGEEVQELAPGWSAEPDRGADVAAHPISGRDQPVLLNANDADRAAIVRRYRLYSAQPDEMITLRALAQMKPGQLQLDPRLYQYGGLWIYPIGAMLKAASLLHLVRLTPDIAFYLDHPEEFGRLYVVMRLYSLMWGVVGVVVICLLARHMTRSRIAAMTASVCFMLLPTVINGAHEAKPHLAGAVLILITLGSAIRAIETGYRRWVIGAGIACGAAASMVLSAALALILLPVMAILMRDRKRKAAVVSIVVAAAVYAVCNPYVIVHLLGDRTVLRSNLENSAAMYQSPATMAGMVNGMHLLLDSGSWVIVFGGFVTVLLAMRKKPIAWLLAAFAVPSLWLFLEHSTAKPGEYARFALPIDVLLVLAAAMGIGILRKGWERALGGGVLCLMLLPIGVSYAWHYGRETYDRSTRLIVADRLHDMSEAGARMLAIDAEPAPYDLPPVDLFLWKILLLPRGSAFPPEADVRIDPVDAAQDSSATVRYWIRPRLLATPISWAAKPFRVETHSSGDVPDESAPK